MIFVTVGTHEQPFDRLIKYVDDLKKEKYINEEVIIQVGYSVYKPQYCAWNNFYSFDEVQNYLKKARIVISHGAPASFWPVLQEGKIPIIVPRQKQFGEHVNNHQIVFCTTLAVRLKNIILINDIESLKNVIAGYSQMVIEMGKITESNNEKFNIEFEKIVNDLFEIK